MVICSLFAGIGGIDLAFKQSDFEVVWANEFDKDVFTEYISELNKELKQTKSMMKKELE